MSAHQFKVGDPEEWRNVEFSGGLYEVSSEGRVRNATNGFVLKGSPIPGGYLTVALHVSGKQATKTIHRLVCLAFHENPENKPAVNHIDGSKTNNRAANLEWVTYRENTLHGVARGTITGGPRRVPDHHRREIVERYRAGGISTRALGSQYGISKHGVMYILKEAVREANYPMEKPLW